jgi:hypothetical protein
MCECGHTCSALDDSSTSTADNSSPSITDMAATNIIIFNNQSDETLVLHEEDKETNFTVMTESDPEVLNMSLSTLDIPRNFVVSTIEPSLNISNSKGSSSLWSSNYTTITKNFTEVNLMDQNVTQHDNRTTTQFVVHKIPNAIPASSISKPETYLQKTRFQSLNKSLSQRLQMITSSSVISAVTEPSHLQQEARSINRERQHIASEVLPSDLTTDQTSMPQHSGLDGSDKLFVLDQNTLWGMLREVVHVELDKKKQPVLEDTSRRSKHSEKTEFD